MCGLVARNRTLIQGGAGKRVRVGVGVKVIVGVGVRNGVRVGVGVSVGTKNVAVGVGVWVCGISVALGEALIGGVVDCCDASCPVSCVLVGVGDDCFASKLGVVEEVGIAVP